MLTEARDLFQNQAARTGDSGSVRVHYCLFYGGIAGRMSGYHVSAAILAISMLAGCSDSIHNEAARGAVDALRARLAADPQACSVLNREGKTALHYAINAAQRDAFIVLVDSGQCDINAADHTGMTPLHCAAFIGLPAAVPTLADAGAEIDARDIYDDTPLHMAAMRGYADMVQALLGAGADPAARNKDGRTPGELAEFYGKSDAAALLRVAQESK